MKHISIEWQQKKIQEGKKTRKYIKACLFFSLFFISSAIFILSIQQEKRENEKAHNENIPYFLYYYFYIITLCKARNIRKAFTCSTKIQYLLYTFPCLSRKDCPLYIIMVANACFKYLKCIYRKKCFEFCDRVENLINLKFLIIKKIKFQCSSQDFYVFFLWAK